MSVKKNSEFSKYLFLVMWEPVWLEEFSTFSNKKTQTHIITQISGKKGKYQRAKVNNFDKNKRLQRETLGLDSIYHHKIINMNRAYQIHLQRGKDSG